MKGFNGWRSSKILTGCNVLLGDRCALKAMLCDMMRFLALNQPRIRQWVLYPVLERVVSNVRETLRRRRKIVTHPKARQAVIMWRHSLYPVNVICSADGRVRQFRAEYPAVSWRGDGIPVEHLVDGATVQRLNTLERNTISGWRLSG